MITILLLIYNKWSCVYMMLFIARLYFIRFRKNHLSEPLLVLISSDNWRSTVFDLIVWIDSWKWLFKSVVLNCRSALAFLSVRNNLFQFYFYWGPTGLEVEQFQKNINSFRIQSIANILWNIVLFRTFRNYNSFH